MKSTGRPIKSESAGFGIREVFATKNPMQLQPAGVIVEKIAAYMEETMRPTLSALCCLLISAAPSAVAANAIQIAATTDAAPKPIETTLPGYKTTAPARAVTGRCAIDFTIRADGTVRDPKVALCYPRGVYEYDSLAGVKGWVFAPAAAIAGGRETPARVVLNFVGLQQMPLRLNYLRPGQWVDLNYTLSDDGVPEDVRVIAQSDPEIQKRFAIQQVRFSRLAPAVADGRPVEVPDQHLRLVADAAPGQPASVLPVVEGLPGTTGRVTYSAFVSQKRIESSIGPFGAQQSPPIMTPNSAPVSGGKS